MWPQKWKIAISWRRRSWWEKTKTEGRRPGRKKKKSCRLQEGQESKTRQGILSEPGSRDWVGAGRRAGTNREERGRASRRVGEGRGSQTIPFFQRRGLTRDSSLQGSEMRRLSLAAATVPSVTVSPRSLPPLFPSFLGEGEYYYPVRPNGSWELPWWSQKEKTRS